MKSRCRLKRAVRRTSGINPSVRARSNNRSMSASGSRCAIRRRMSCHRSSGTDLITPRALIGGQPVGGQRVGGQGWQQRLGGKLGAEQAVVDAAAGRRFDESRCIPHRHDAIARRPGDRPERQHLVPGRTCFCQPNAPPRRDPFHHLAEMTAGVRRAHHTDPHTLAIVPFDRHRPGEAAGCGLRSKVDFDGAKALGRQLGLCRLQRHSRAPELETAVQRVARAAGQHAGAGPHRDVAANDGDSGRVHIHPGGARSPECHAQTRRTRGQLAVERHAIDHDRLDLRRRGLDRVPGRRVKPDRGEVIQDAGLGDPEPLECLTRQHAGAMNRLADRGVLFEKFDTNTSGSEASGRVESRGTAADDHDVSCIGTGLRECHQ